MTRKGKREEGRGKREVAYHYPAFAWMVEPSPDEGRGEGEGVG